MALSMTFKEYGTGSFAPSVCSRLIYSYFPGFPFARQTAWIFHALYQFNTFFSLLLLHLL